MKSSFHWFEAVVSLVSLAALCPAVAAQKPGGKAMSMTIESSAFAAGKTIPKKYTGDGADVSPPLSWKGVPPATQELALICDDPDAPSPQPWVHWLIYNIPAKVSELPEKIPAQAELNEPVVAMQGKNSWPGNSIGYRGPSPPKGRAHHYHFTLFALDGPLNVPAGIDKAALEKAMQGHVLAEAELIGTYGR